ncbi:hypothetical protein ACFL2T_05305, partial [Elusimicrobiota bacterium]
PLDLLRSFKEDAAPLTVAGAPVSEPTDGRFLNSGDAGFKRAILDNRVPVDAWVDSLNESGPELLCLGETHDEAFRHDLAVNIFSKLEMDTLFLEAVPEEVTRFQSELAAGAETVTMLGADIAELLRTAQGTNPGLRIVGIEETDGQQRSRRDDPRIQRDSVIAWNLLQSFQPGKKHVALYGSLHCAKNDLGLGGSSPFYRHLIGDMGPERVRSAIVSRGAGGGDIFAVFLQLFGLSDESFVIPDTSLIPPSAYDYNWNLRKHFDNYRAIVYIAGPQAPKDRHRR